MRTLKAVKDEDQTPPRRPVFPVMFPIFALCNSPCHCGCHTSMWEWKVTYIPVHLPNIG